MIPLNIRLSHVSETSVMLYLADEIDVTLAAVIGRITERIQDECQLIREVTPSYTSILIETDAFGVELVQLCKYLLDVAHEESDTSASAQPESAAKRIELPVYYHPEVGSDLEAVARHANLTVDQVIAIHSGCDYTVCAIGFAPGFAFLANVDERIGLPRHNRPRAKVPAGSVAIAEKQTAVYPEDSPGGWQLIGNCPTPLFDPLDNPMSPFVVGDRVRFVPISLDEFLERGGRV